MANLSNKKVVITGGAGFIGSNLARALAPKNDVVVLDNLTTGHLKNLKSVRKDITFTRGDINDKPLLKRAFRNADYVLHQAALCSVPRSVTDPYASNHSNITGTLQVLIAARDAGVKRVVFAASSSAYGNSVKLPKREDMPANPESPYALSKLAGEQYMRIFSELYGLQTMSLRYFNIFGPFQDPDSQYSAVVPLFANALLRKRNPVIFGDGKTSRDFTYIDNVVQANILACKARKTRGEVVNIACGKRISLIQLVKELNKVLGTSSKPKFAKERVGDVKHSLADISRAKRLLGYKPVVQVAEGLAKTADFYRETLVRR